MNVLMICTEKLPVPNIRGGAIQTYICGISDILSRQHRLTIIGRSDPDLPNEEVVNGIRYIRIDSNNFLDIYIRGVIEYLESHQEQYDIIHIFNRPKMVLPVRKIAPNSRIILSMHNDMFTPKKLNNEEGHQIIETLDTIVTISNYVGATICQYYPEAETKIRTIYSGVDSSLFVPWEQSNKALQIRQNLRSQHQLDGKKVILSVGRLSRNKGPHVLIRALPHLKHSDVALVIVGASWYSDNSINDYIAYIRALANRSPVPVITTGYIQAHDVHQWFSVGDVFVCTSIWNEPLARVHYEAMATGLPFITTARGGNPEIIRNQNGLLVNNPEDPLEYATYLNDLFSNMASSKQMGLRGRKLVEQNFTWNDVANQVLSVWG